jgi:ATP-dependent RNA helicase RhlE
MLDMGFIPAIRRIVSLMPTSRQTMLFSATMAPEIVGLAADYMRDAQRIEVASQGTAADQIEQLLCYVSNDRKPEVLETLLTNHTGPTLVFSRTKHGAAKLSRKLSEAGHNATELHSNRSLAQRRHSLDGFKAGRYRVLVATDVASRGIDVKDIALVVNYDLPDVASDYVHRIGRTGRAGKSGIAITLAAHDQYRDVQTIERLMNKQLPLSELSEERRITTPMQSQSRNSRGGGRPGGGRPNGGRSNGGSGWGRPSRFGPSEGAKARRPQVSFE